MLPTVEENGQNFPTGGEFGSALQDRVREQSSQIWRMVSDGFTVGYYEFSDGKSEKFWEIGRDGCDKLVRDGRIGTSVQTRVTSFNTERATT